MPPSPLPQRAAPAASDWPTAAAARVWRYLRFLGCPADVADDCVQDTLVAALRDHAADGAGPATGWLLVTARNRFRMHLRTAGRELPDLDLLHAQWHQVVGADAGDRQLAALRLCLEELPARSRTALELRYRDGADRGAIGAAVGLRAEGVKSLLERLRAALAACVQRRLPEGP